MTDAVRDSRAVVGLFDLPDGTVVPTEEDTRTHGQRRRDRQTAAIQRGQHPLSLALGPLPLHPVAQRELSVPNGPSCGTCAWRRHLHGGNRSYPKCTAHAHHHLGTRHDGRRHVWHTYPRATHGEGTDIRAGFPGCRDWTPIPEAVTS